MLRIALAILALLAIQAPATAQLQPYQWRIGVSAGYATYHGDLSPFRIDKFSEIGKVFRLFDLNPNYVPQASFGLSIETRLNHTLGLSLKGGHYVFAMSDRFVDRRGNLKINSPHFNRGLNFKTEVTDIGLSLVFRSDNGKILNKKALVAPYLGLGLGVFWYDVYGDLYHSNGQPYAHSDQTTTDGQYETALRPLRTELTDGYGKSSFYGELSLGIRFRLAHRWELFIQSDIKYTATDYLDDVSGKYRNFYTSAEQQYAANPTGLPEDGGKNYRGNPNGHNDFYLYHAAGLKFSFGHSKEAFRAPVVHPSVYRAPAEPAKPTRPAVHEKPKKPEVPDLSKAKEVQLDPVMEHEVAAALQFIQHEFEVLAIRKETSEVEAKRDSLQLVVDRLSAATDSIGSQRDSLGISDSTAIMLTALNVKMAQWEKQLDSLANLHREVEQRYTLIDTVLTFPQTTKLAVSEVFMDSTTLQPVAPKLQPQADSTTVPEVRIDQPENDQSELIGYLKRQERRDSILIDRLTTLVEQSNPPSTWRSAPASEPQQDEQTDQRSYSGETDRTELESLRTEVEQLKELIRAQNSVRSTPSSGTNLGVVVAPTGGKKDKKEEGSVDSSQLQDLQMQVATLQHEMVELRKQNRLQQFEFEQRLEQQSAIVGVEAPVDSLANDSLATDSVSAAVSVQSATDALTDSVTKAAPARLDTTQQTPDRESAATPTPTESKVDSTQQKPAADTPPKEVEKPAQTEPKKVTIYFDLNAKVPASGELDKIASAARHWKSDKTQRVVLKSYADNSGNADYNRQLCEKRNAAVKQILVNQFDVDSSAIESSVGGPVERPNQPVYNPSDRRVEIAVGF